MKPKSGKSLELYRIMVRSGYPEPFCDEVTKNLNTDWTAQRMIGYLRHNSPPDCSTGSTGVPQYRKVRLEDIADEMLAILDDRNRIMNKKENEAANARWNYYLANGFGDEEEL